MISTSMYRPSRGFTLIELLVVVVIIAGLVALLPGPAHTNMLIQ
jgi:prepilin-type N-terminal cleavage/methylation domain-containing protein